MAAYNCGDMSSDDDIEIIEYIEHVIERQRAIVIRPEHYYIWNDKEFVMRFRLQKGTVLMLLQQIEATLETPTDR